MVRADERLVEALPNILKEDYNRLARTIADAPVQGTVAKAKWLLSQATSAKASLSQKASIAVHKFGPVPTFDLKKSVYADIHGQILEVPILAFFNPPTSGTKIESAENIPYFLQALEIDPQRIFNRYFEDVASRMLDICEHGNIVNSIAWLREIEAIIGESITSKLRIIKPRTEAHEGGKPRKIDDLIDGIEWNDWKHPQDLNERDLARHSFFTRNAELVYFVNYMRNALLYLVNCAYIPFGIHAEDDRYAKRILREDERFRRFFGPDRNILSEARNAYPEFDELVDFIAAYRQGDEDALHMTSTPSGVGWLANVKTFVRHLHHVGNETRSAERTSFFISYHYDDQRSERTSDFAAQYIKMLNAGDVHRAPSYKMGTWFREHIKASIWASDRVFSFAVGDPRHASLGREKGFDWLFAESEHALRQAKSTVFFLDEAWDVSHYRAKIADADHATLLTSRRFTNAERKSDFQRIWQDSQHVLSQFNQNSLDPRIASRIEEECKKSSKSHRISVLTGFLSLFDPDYIDLIVKHLIPATKSDVPLARKDIKTILDQTMGNPNEPLPSVEEATAKLAAKFTKYATSSNGRSIIVNGKKYWAVRVDSIHKTLNSYLITLGEVVLALFPEEPYHERMRILAQCHDVATLAKAGQSA